MKDNQHEQQLTEAPLFEEISDNNSASITGGATAPIGGGVPGIGSSTFPTPYTTTKQFKDIAIRLTQNPYDVKVKAVRTRDLSDISEHQTTIPANDHSVYIVAANVRDNTPFRLDFQGEKNHYRGFDIVGRITY
jgi:hypothetical protein